MMGKGKGSKQKKLVEKRRSGYEKAGANIPGYHKPGSQKK